MVSLIDLIKSAKRDLYKHQLDFVSDVLLMQKPRVLLADDVGLGKTVQAVLLIKAFLELRRARSVLIIVPRSVLYQWASELERFGIEFEVVESHDFAFGHRVYLITLDRAKAPQYLRKLSEVRWDLVVVDEAHKIRLDTQRLQVAQLCRDAEGCLLLTATPHTGDDRDYRFLLGLVGGVVVRREKKDVEEYEGRRIFPRLRYWIVKVRGDRREVEVLDELLRLTELLNIEPIVRVVLEKRAMSSPASFLKTLSKVAGGECSGEVLEEGELDGCLGRVAGLRQLEELVRRYGDLPDAKLMALRRLLERLKGRRVLIFTEYATTAEYLFRELAAECKIEKAGEGYGMADCGDYGVMYATSKAREKMDVEVEAANLAARPAVFISTDILSEGVNLQSYDVVINYEVVWSPTKLIQRIGRIWRFGQRSEEVLAVDMVLDVGRRRGEFSMYEELLEKLYHISLHALPPQSYGEFEIYEITRDDVRKVVEVGTSVYLSDDRVLAAMRDGTVERLREAVERIIKERERLRWKPKEVVEESLRVKLGFLSGVAQYPEAGGGYYVVETVCRSGGVELLSERQLVRLPTPLSRSRSVQEAFYRESWVDWDVVEEDPGEVKKDEEEEVGRRWQLDFNIPLMRYLDTTFQRFFRVRPVLECSIRSIKRARVVKDVALGVGDFEDFVRREIRSSLYRERTERAAAMCVKSFLMREGYSIEEDYRSVPRPFDMVVRRDVIYTVEVKGKWVGKREDPISFTANEVDWASKFADRHIVCIAYVDGDKCEEVECLLFSEFQKKWVLETVRGIEYKYNARRRH